MEAAASLAKAADAANFLEIELQSIDNLPPTWAAAENGAAPLYSEHPFRYQVEVLGLKRPAVDAEVVAAPAHAAPPSAPGSQPASAGPAGAAAAAAALNTSAADAAAAAEASTAYRFTNGRLLQQIPVYTDFIAHVPRTREQKIEESDDVPTAPGAAPPPPPGSARQAADTTAVPSSAPSSILFVLTPAAEASEIKEEAPAVVKKDAKGKKNAPPPPPVAVEPTKPVAPGRDELAPFLLRIPLHQEALAHIEGLVERNQNLTLQFSRALKSNAPAEWEDPFEGRFRANIHVSLKPLAAPGATTFATVARLEPLEPEAKEEEKGKKKAPPKKSKTNIPSLLTEEPEAGDNHPYTIYGTCARLVVFTKCAITRLPQSRPMPNLQPADLVPKRVRPARRPLEATKQFTKEVGKLAERIVDEFREHARTTGLEGEEARNSFLSFLQGSGHALAYQQLLAPIVQAVVKERFVKKAAPSRAELEMIINELYGYLLDQLHVAMDRVFGQQSATVTASALDGDDDARWERLAAEAELMREIPTAIRYYQERLGQARDEAKLADIWCDYGEFCLRVRDVLRAEQSFHEALALDGTHPRALIAYGLLLVSRNRPKEAEVFLQSAADIDGSAVSWAAVALFWEVLQVTASDGDAHKDLLAVYQRESKQAIAQALRTDPSLGTPERAYETLGRRLVALHLEDLANFALAKAAAASFDVDLLYATLFLQADQLDEAADILTARLQSGECSGRDECRARVLLGDVYSASERPIDAEQAYDAALRIDPDCAPSASLVRLGNIYVQLGRYKDALSTFLVAAKQWPCGLTWLGVGIAYYRLEDLGRAEQALNESNILSNLNPKTWAYLALLCLRQRRDEDAEGAFNQAVKLGVSDPHLIAEVGAEYYRSGNLAVAEASFRRALAFADDAAIRMHLARTLAAMKQFGEAREQYGIVAETGTSEHQRAKAAEQLELLPQGDGGRARDP